METLILRVLLVDDDYEDRQMIRDALTDGIRRLVIKEMGTGQELINWLAHQRSLALSGRAKDSSYVTVILLDMHMPELSGLETLQSLGDLSDLGYMPVVMLTTAVSDQIKQLAYEKGLHLYMVKPSSYRGFYRVVEAVKLCYRDALRMRDQLGTL